MSQLEPRLHDILALLDGALSQRRILVVGDVMLDRYIWGEVERISPEAPVPVLRHSRSSAVMGGAANVAANLAGLGAKATLCGFWGDDADRAELDRLLKASAIDASGMVVCSRPTVSKTRIVARRQQMLRLDVEQVDGHSQKDRDALRDSALKLAETADAIVLSDYAKGVLDRDLCHQLIQIARRRMVPILVDPKDRDFTKYSGATTICPNLKELSQATGVPVSSEKELLAKAQALVKKCSLDFLTVTMSEKGILVLRGDSQYHSPARAREVFDVSGAGDTVIAVLAAVLSAGLDIETAVALANVAAGVVVGKVGTAPIDRAELVAELTPQSNANSAEKVMPRDRVLVRVAEWRAAGNRIVFTNGCFDVLHVGHITLLEKCREFGDRLVLGINTDASVQRLKGASRPVVNERDRARVLSALAAVDAVVLFDEDTPLELIRSIQPDVLVKGGDYTEATVVGAELVRAKGGRVEIVPTVEGFSTTAILQRMKS